MTALFGDSIRPRLPKKKEKKKEVVCFSERGGKEKSDMDRRGEMLKNTEI